MKYLTCFLSSFLLFQSTVSGELASKINQSGNPPAVKVKNPFRSLLLDNKDLTSLTKSPSKPERPERNILHKIRRKSFSRM